jgi:ApeA N-terminal domain 1
MPKNDDRPPSEERITAEWSPVLSAEPTAFGTALLGESALLRFPILHAYQDIPVGTTVLWGVADDLTHCTAVTLPFRGHGRTSGGGRSHFSAESPIVHLVRGRTHVPAPKSACVREIMFDPEPNAPLHRHDLTQLIQPKTDIERIDFAPGCAELKKKFVESEYAYFVCDPPTIFEAHVEKVGITFSARLTGRVAPDESPSSSTAIMFRLRFDSLKTIDDALDDAVRLCALLTLLSHAYVAPSSFVVRIGDGPAAHDLFTRALSRTSRAHSARARNTLVIPDVEPAHFAYVLQRWYATIDTRLGNRFLYRHSMSEPDVYTTERFLDAFKAVEGVVPREGYGFLTADELEKVEEAVRTALPGHKKLGALFGKLRSNNAASLKYILSQELPKFLASRRRKAEFNVSDFVERIYSRRIRSSHGGSHSEQLGNQLLEDTMLLTSIYLLFEAADIGIDVHDALAKFRAALHHELPLVPS